MVTRYRCPNCGQEFENSTGDSICPRCKTTTFQIGSREDEAAEKEIVDMEPSSQESGKKAQPQGAQPATPPAGAAK